MISISNKYIKANFGARGAALHSLYFIGVDHSLVFGSIDQEAYKQPSNYLGAIVGPVANRIRNGRALIDEKLHEFDKNFGRHTLHGGEFGMSELDWEVLQKGEDFVVFSMRLENGHMGFPGPIDVNVEYLLDGAALEINIHANTAIASLVNIAPHIYFNLSGASSIASHKLKIDAEQYLPVDHDLIATGEIAPVKNTPYDFRKLKMIKNTVMDNSFVLMSNAIPALILEAANMRMALKTNQNAIHVYTADHFEGQGLMNLQGDIVGRGAALAIEPQNFPNAPEYAHFPSIELRTNEKYINRSRFEFLNQST